MALTFPIKLDHQIILRDEEGDFFKVNVLEVWHLEKNYFFEDERGNGLIVSGYDSSIENDGRGLRVTNLHYIKNGIVFKRCPSCERSYSFGSYSTRSTNERRDQSDCEGCRKAYNR